MIKHCMLWIYTRNHVYGHVRNYIRSIESYMLIMLCNHQEALPIAMDVAHLSTGTAHV